MIGTVGGAHAHLRRVVHRRGADRRAVHRASPSAGCPQPNSRSARRLHLGLASRPVPRRVCRATDPFRGWLVLSARFAIAIGVTRRVPRAPAHEVHALPKKDTGRPRIPLCPGPPLPGSSHCMDRGADSAASLLSSTSCWVGPASDCQGGAAMTPGTSLSSSNRTWSQSTRTALRAGAPLVAAAIAFSCTAYAPALELTAKADGVPQRVESFVYETELGDQPVADRRVSEPRPFAVGRQPAQPALRRCTGSRGSAAGLSRSTSWHTARAAAR